MSAERSASAPASVTVLYFAALRDLAGRAEEQLGLAAAPQPVQALLLALEQRHGSLRGKLDAVRVAVNEEFVEKSSPLHGGEVVALIPPVSGG